MAVCGVAPVADVMPVFTSIVHIPALQKEHLHYSFFSPENIFDLQGSSAEATARYRWDPAYVLQ